MKHTKHTYTDVFTINRLLKFNMKQFFITKQNTYRNTVKAYSIWC